MPDDRGWTGTPTTTIALAAAVDAMTEEVRERYAALDEAALNWKPEPDRWSVGQCLDHLITTNATYFPKFEEIVEGRFRPGIRHRVPGLPALWGRLLLNAIEPQTTRKLKAPRIFQPSSSRIDAGVVNRFLAQQAMLADFLRKAETLEPGRIVISSPVSSWIVYSLLDAFRIVVAHERRHLNQAARVTETAGFPRG
jgi:hypothetical protein